LEYEIGEKLDFEGWRIPPSFLCSNYPYCFRRLYFLCSTMKRAERLVNDQFEDDYPDIFELEEAADDPKLPEAIKAIRDLFQQQPGRVFYEKQIEVLLEKKLYHWITTKALRQLREAGEIRSELESLYPRSPAGAQQPNPENQIRFYFHKQNRYIRRQEEEIKRLVRQFTDQRFTNALGNQGELLVDAGLPRAGFQPIGYNVRSHGQRVWTATNHNLDRVFIRDGVAYGVEIKNRLQYISSEEWTLKLKMCVHLGLVPLFIARMMPGSYIYTTMKVGGFCLIMGYQFYPITHEHLAKAVRDQLGLPVDCPLRLQDGTLQRLLNFHQNKLRRLPSPEPR
jgi:hypothetical protein